MEKIKHFIDVIVPVTSCTLRCSYCYVTTHHLFNNKLPSFKYSVENWKEALSKERWGGPCLINFCAAGETLLAPEIVDYIRVTLEQGHFVMVVTNATVNRAFEDFSRFNPELLERLFFKFSFHYQQLHERKLTDRFFSNVRKMRDLGASFTIEITPHDELIPHIQDIKDIVKKEIGAWPHVTVGRDESDMSKIPLLTSLSREKYIQTWNSFDSALFDFKMHIFGVKRQEFCNAGLWLHYLRMDTGELYGCHNQPFSQNILIDPKSKIEFHPVGHWCREPHCFNGHTWLGLGAIERFAAPTYADMRNRKCEDGCEWLSPLMKEVMNSRLWENNKPLTTIQKLHSDLFTFGLLLKNKIIASCKHWH